MCRQDAKSKATPISERSVNNSHTLADVKVTDFVESNLNDSSKIVLDMNKIDEICMMYLWKIVLLFHAISCPIVGGGGVLNKIHQGGIIKIS